MKHHVTHFIKLAALALLVSSGLYIPAPASGRISRPPARITLIFFDRNGSPLSADKALDRMAGLKGRKDASALINSVNWQVMENGVVRKLGRDLVFDVTSNSAALVVNWPTTRGYSLLILDNGGAGYGSAVTINFTFQAASDTRRRLDEALAARTDYKHSEAFRNAYARADQHLKNAAASSVEPVRGKEGYLALDDLAEAFDLMLAEYGPSYRKEHLETLKPWMGITLDDISGNANSLEIAKGMTAPYSWVRIVFDAGQKPEAYDQAVTTARNKGFKILGAPIDSDAAKKYITTESYLQRMKAFVDHFPNIDAWEVGNEVNGNWLITKPDKIPRGEQFGSIADKIEASAVYVRRNAPNAQVVVTLYWQLNTSGPEFSTFNWARVNLPMSTRDKIDVVLLSTWVEDAPLGIAFDQLMRVMQQEFPGKQIGLGELGHWGDGTPKAWWAFDERDRAVARRKVAAQYYPAALGYESSIGGGFWWYFYTDIVKNNDTELRSIITTVTHSLSAR